MKRILITGANGQLGRCLKDVFRSAADIEAVYTDAQQLDIADREAVAGFFSRQKFDYCINAAAYTQVDKAEEETGLANRVNADGPAYLGAACKEGGCVLVQVSTDYVFDGRKRQPYTEDDPTNPLGAYGRSKLNGEKAVMASGADHFILRTSWLYSQYGHNFFKTVQRIIGEGRKMKVTTEQTGAPTNANDLAAAILEIIRSGSDLYGLYHFSNAGTATWYDFALAILQQHPDFDNTNLEKTDHYRTLAARPEYSVLSNDKIREKLEIEQVHWKDSLKELIEQTA